VRGRRSEGSGYQEKGEGDQSEMQREEGWGVWKSKCIIFCCGPARSGDVNMLVETCDDPFSFKSEVLEFKQSRVKGQWETGF
jgi:hypothetical protein